MQLLDSFLVLSYLSALVLGQANEETVYAKPGTTLENKKVTIAFGAAKVVQTNCETSKTVCAEITGGNTNFTITKDQTIETATTKIKLTDSKGENAGYITVTHDPPAGPGALKAAQAIDVGNLTVANQTLAADAKFYAPFLVKAFNPEVKHTIDNQQTEVTLNGLMGQEGSSIQLEGLTAGTTFTLKVMPEGSSAIIKQLCSATYVLGLTLYFLNH